MSQVVIVSGPAGAGKSSVCVSLCGRYDRTVHLRTDEFFASIRMGFIKPWHQGSHRQNVMVTRAAARAATAYAQELYAVFIDGVIGPHLLPIYVEELAVTQVPVHLVLLHAPADETVRRAIHREGTLRVQEPVIRELHRQFDAYGHFAGAVVETGGLTADQSADRVMQVCGDGRALVTAGQPA